MARIPIPHQVPCISQPSERQTLTMSTRLARQMRLPMDLRGSFFQSDQRANTVGKIENTPARLRPPASIAALEGVSPRPAGSTGTGASSSTAVEGVDML